MTEESVPFYKNAVTRRSALREALRIAAVVLATTFMVSRLGHMSGITLLWLVLVYSIPLFFLITFIRWFMRNVKLKSFALTLAICSVLYTLLLLMCVLPVLLLTGAGNLSQVQRLLLQISPVFLAAILTVLSFRGVARKLGGAKMMLNWVRGYYHTPKQEDRIFMFLDMRDSTALAEKLGNLKFSALVRDFFDDLTNPVIESRGEVSHYIGDEAVITWRTARGLENANCAQCFFRMKVALEKRRGYYLSNYGLFPKFKAGAHLGRVVVTEVGSLKSEIVFHGDVLNTAARVQAQCSAYETDFLITKELADQLPSEPWLSLKEVGEVALKGKEGAIELVVASCPVLEPSSAASLTPPSA